VDGAAGMTTSPALGVKDLAVRFGGVVALGGVSFDVAPGSVTSLIGPNGAGKTTAFNTITGFERPTAGRVSHEGVLITGWPPHAIAQRGLVRTFQRTSLFPGLSVIDNVRTGLHLRGRIGLFSAWLARGQVREEERRLSDEGARVIDFVSLGHRRDDLASALSYGDQRRLELAVALAAGPRLLLLDEPASGMTGAEKVEMARLIGKIREEAITVLLVEHDMRLVMGISDRVLVLNNGQLIADGTAAEVQRDREVVRAYLGGSIHAHA